MAPFRKMFSRPCELGVETGPYLQQARDAAVDLDAPAASAR